MAREGPGTFSIPSLSPKSVSGTEEKLINIPKVSNSYEHLHILDKQFRAGQVALPKHVLEWEKLTSDPEIIQIVKGDIIRFEMPPPEKTTAKPCNVSPENKELIDLEIRDMFEKEIIIKTSHEDGEFVSPIFPRPKPDGRLRIILNLKQLNGYMEYLHFKMDNIKTVLSNVTRDCLMASIDLKSAYYSIKIDDEYQKFLKFKYDDELYQFTCYPNGLAPCPRKFTKVMKVPTSYLREIGHFILGYIDDFFLKANNTQKCNEAVEAAINLFQKLGFTIHSDKSQFEPTTCIIFLGFVIDSVAMTIKLTDEKKSKLINLIRQVLDKNTVTIRTVASLVGKMVSSLPGTLYGPLYYRDTELCKNKALKLNRGNYESNMQFSEEAKTELTWWLENIDTMYAPIQWPPITQEISADASGENGWGASIHGWGASIVGVAPIGGLWSENEIDLHINVKEMLAVLYALRTFVRQLSRCHVRVLSDNTTTVFVLNKMGTTKSKECNEMARIIWNFCKENKIFITCAHIPGKENVIADMESRRDRNYKQAEWMLNRELFQQAIAHFNFQVDLDGFATCANAQVEKYVSRYPDPFATKIDAFSFNWTQHNLYLFPPFSLISKTLQKVRIDQATVLGVFPKWTTQAWWSNLQDMIIGDPLIFPPKPHNLVLPHKKGELHPLHAKLSLVICMLSGKNTV